MHKLIERLKEAMSSEHASYKSSKKYLKELPTKGENVIQGPGENAGIIDIGGDYALAFRIESHNHPSYINPYEGSATGVGGILRDIFTMGARPIGLLYFFRVGEGEKGNEILEGVTKGVSDYGNCVGVPVVGGDVFIDKTYEYNPLVNVSAFGLVKKQNIIYANALNVGSKFIYVGARTGKDGIGGSEMASKPLKENLDESSIQKSDPFLEKLLLEACCELAEKNLVEGMQDMGAAGLLCSTAEQIKRGTEKTGKSLGAKIYLDKVPVKCEMTPEEILLSETQERMMIVSTPENEKEILEIFKKWDLEAEVVGIVTDDGKYTLVYSENKEEKIISSDYKEIFPEIDEDWDLVESVKQDSKHQRMDKEKNKEIYQQFDWLIGRRTIKGPSGDSNHSILDIPEIGKEIIISFSSDEGKSNYDAKDGIKHAFQKCIDCIKQEGGEPLALVNNLNFGHPKDSMLDFKETVFELKRLCEENNLPVVGGNVSLYNSYKEKSIKPTPVLVMVGVRGQEF